MEQELRHAAASGEIDKVKEFCKKSVPFDADIEGRTALHYAAANGHTAVLKELIVSGPKLNAKDALGYTPLLHAATDGHVEAVKLLLKNNASVDVQDDVHFNSALHEASWKGYSQTVEALCKHKANTYLKNKQGHTALHLACQQGHNQTSRILLMAGCKPDIKNNFGDSPLHSAARYGHAGVVRILLSAFCSVNDVNKNGDTALHISAAMGRRKLTRILLEAGCNPTIPNKQGETAMDIALRKTYSEVQEIIANPPPLKMQTTHPIKTSKREKESSQGSKDSNEKSRNERFKKTKSGSSRSVHFTDEKTKKIASTCNWSPYGCHLHPNVNDFPKPKLDSLPSDPLTKGEQYYIDLAGNIRKGPVGKSHKCYCTPLLQRVEKKMESDKRELIDHIDNTHDSLNNKICNLEKKTHNQLVTLNETVKEKLAHEREECNERANRCALRERIEFERRQRLQVEQLKGEVKTWLNTKLENHRRSSNEHLDQTHHQHHYHNHHHNHNHKNKIERTTSQVNVPQVIYHQQHHQQIERPKSSQGGPAVNSDKQQTPTVSRSKSEMYLTASAENSDEEAISNEMSFNQIEVINRTDTPNTKPDYLQTNGDYGQDFAQHEDFEKLGARPKEQVSVKKQIINEVNVISDNSGSSPEQNRVEDCINANSNDNILSQEPEHIDDINLSADLMKSLRCNGNAYNSGEHGDSPFNDSGYRTKFSPSPRDASVSVVTLPNLQNNRVAPKISPPIRYNQPQHYIGIVSDPPIGLPPPQTNYMRRFQVPVNIHAHHLYSGPNSSLV